MTSPLFNEFSVRGLTLPNRIVMAPMTRNFAPGGVPGAHNAEYYRKRAEGGTGLILTEGTVVDRPEAANHPAIPHFHGEQALAGWQEVVEAVHGAGGKIAPQIWHTGAVKAQRPDAPRPGEPEGPSGLFKPDEPNGKAMTEEDVEDTVAAFVSAAKDAQRLGFDTIEFHGAHGYLIDQFFWDGTNQREDRWGGDSLTARTAFATEILKRTRAAVAEDMPIILRISQWNQQDYTRRLATTPDELEAWVAPLVDAGADVLHCSQRRFWEPEFPELDGEKGLNFAGWVKKLAGVPTISVGSVALDGDFFSTFKGEAMAPTDLGDLEERMDRGEFDLIAVGRALIANPDWANMVREGRVADLQGYRAEQLGELV
ncbi:NADH:flavin oxidoreductase [Paraurantiacibacter namhicola]|uniref:NADH oxidase n=1 Tax=Paraurantiacibacter namhicola TaxID=645517 RepID=A0A1C7D8M2_9SPHN|nr:NADH:flavin oxidoreductase [Paraurantiacibacter namhicola]ANU07830.1 NADH oxidase [Paraurantiacibacter namhicola]